MEDEIYRPDFIHEVVYQAFNGRNKNFKHGTVEYCKSVKCGSCCCIDKGNTNNHREEGTVCRSTGKEAK